MTIDLESISLIGLSPTQYIILYYIAHSKNLQEIVFYKNDVDRLIKTGLLEDRGKVLYLTPDSSSLFKSIDYEESWAELRREYPSKSGIRRLQGSLDKTKNKYINLLKKGEAKHSEVLKAIAIEKQERHNATLTRTWMADWKLLSTYINNKEWQVFLENDEETEKFKDPDKI